VGLIPAGGGTKEMLLRAVDAAAALAPPDPRDPPSRFAQSAEMATALRRSFETIALAKVSTSAAEARTLGLLGPADRITMNRERLLLDAKAQGCGAGRRQATRAPAAHADSRAGHGGAGTLETGIFLMGEAGYASEHDQKGRSLGGVHPGRRPGDAGHPGQRAVPAGPGARGVSLLLRRAQDAGADCLHAEDRQAAAELDVKMK
jgi:hypothetical protein